MLYFHEINCLILAENIVNYYHSRARATNWAAWAMEFPKQAAILAEAEKLFNALSQ